MGVAIGVENVWNKFLLSPLEMRDFLDKIASENVACYFDVGNVVLTGYPEQWIDILGHRIKRVHLKDFKRSVGTLDGFCDLLDGDVDYAAVMAALRRVGYDGPLTAEFFNCEGKLEQLSSAMDRILAMA
jgi:hexulose-6-phosphate isomerase